MDTTEELKQLIKYWINHSHRHASVYEEWAEKVKEIEHGDEFANALREAAKKVYESARYLEAVNQIYSHSDLYE